MKEEEEMIAMEKVESTSNAHNDDNEDESNINGDASSKDEHNDVVDIDMIENQSEVIDDENTTTPYVEMEETLELNVKGDLEDEVKPLHKMAVDADDNSKDMKLNEEISIPQTESLTVEQESSEEANV